MSFGNLSDRAMLVDFKASSWGGGKTDKKASDEVAVNNNSDRRMGSFHKKLINSDAFKQINQVYNKAYGEHRRRTLPWFDSGVRILSASGYFEYAAKQSALQMDYDAAVDEFMNLYQQNIELARTSLGKLFNEDDYPSPELLRVKFGISYRIMPMPTATDFRVDLAASELSLIQEDIEKQQQEALKLAMNSMVERVTEVVGKMHERIQNYSGLSSDSSLREAVVDNVKDLAGLLPSLNITGDPRINEIAAEMETTLCAHSAATLRLSDEARSVVAAEAEAIMNKMRDFVL